VATLELYGAAWCPHTRDLREELEWQRRDFVEYDIDLDATARQRLLELAGGVTGIPVLVENNRVVEVGWQGRTCMISTGASGCGGDSPAKSER
jgi:glutaredoxin